MGYQEVPPSVTGTVSPTFHGRTSFRQTAWACLRLTRLHDNFVAYCDFPSPAIYTTIFWFAFNKSNMLEDERCNTLLECGGICMRLAFCILIYRSVVLAWDDLIDRNYDGLVSRTKVRPLPAGDISIDAACLFIAGLTMICGLAFDTLLPVQALRATFIGAAIAIPYPFLKRFTSSAQVFGSLLFSCGVLQGWMSCATANSSGWAGFWQVLRRDWQVILPLLAIEFSFEIVHELIYGNQDTSEDIHLGLHSLSLYLGPAGSYYFAAAGMLIYILLLWFTLLLPQFPGIGIALSIITIRISYETWILDTLNPASCGRWAKRAFQAKLFLCISLFCSFLLSTAGIKGFIPGVKTLLA